ncbi:MAG TPA: chromosomal replication initiator protein DnaA [Candidatus Portnoybacteria bacterium]|mgnify:CR=1 FL=1|jgi:chromosomal replication initiator protein|nr:chromosomal replication initiator protein DnaA [Candidatus Portnoybacteria bacterium]MDD5752149.1 chromosomal replication initiator protein DnaA [Candidatus Portnoybacteria bacterium]HOZ16455.1 chromosomal replication initiator protein DnaA [Candidatus Portnoybacteria bacterium]HPH52113.1 chromosomal replication initiator protein DnaA [Candidatus Portnoybacteria bacterium]HPJ80274.1 chromosomal replication initiator protein DnaA [Candidatus Portnoybacteria bacterium]
MTNNELWQSVLNEVQLSISKPNFTTWFKNTSVVSQKNGEVVIGVPNGFTKEWLENKYNKIIISALRSTIGKIKSVKYIISSSIKPSPETKGKNKKRTEERKIIVAKEQLDIQEYKIDENTNLNPRYTFDSFVVASFNELAHAAAQSVIKDLGRVYNPLFVYGGVGVGKTHLIQAIGNEVKNKGKNIIYVSSEKFSADLITSISERKVEEFKNKYRKVDMLIIDDIQFLAGKEKTQEIFFHTFNNLYEKNKQIIISSDRPPKAISTLEERLRSRFEGGMIADISMPEYETRLVILKKKAEELGVKLSEEAFSYIASNIQKNIRELEGALNRVVAFIRLNNTNPTQKQLIQILKTVITNPKKRTNYKKIAEIVAEFYDVNINDLINRSRKQEVVKPRQIAMYLMREELKSSYPFIGQKLGGRDHTTAIYACNKIDEELKNNNELEQELNLIKERLYSGPI